MRLGDYVKELNKIKLLSPEEELALWQAFSDKGDENARRQLIQSYQPLVFKQALPFKELESVMDIIQEGTVGLIEAVESYDYHRGVAFSLFAVHRIRGRILNFIQKERNAEIACIDDEKDGCSPKDLLVDTAAPIAEQIETRELSLRVRNAMERLPQKERLVLEQVYIGSGEVKDVAAELNMSASHIYRLQKTGIRRIRGMLSKFMQNW